MEKKGLSCVRAAPTNKPDDVEGGVGENRRAGLAQVVI